MSTQCAAENADRPEYLLRLTELELIDRHRRMLDHQICAALFPVVKSLGTLDFPAAPLLNEAPAIELARCEYLQRRENVLAASNSGT